jgi:hypothetical protein
LIYDGYKSLLGASAGDAHATLSASVESHLESGHTAEIRAPHVHGILEARLGREPADLHLPVCLINQSYVDGKLISDPRNKGYITTSPTAYDWWTIEKP